MMRAALHTFALAVLCAGGDLAAAPTNAVRQTGPGLFEIGVVRLDATKRQLTIPAAVNMTEGPVEYVLVSAIGKLHESIFKTEAEPVHIHAAALLLVHALSNAPANVTIAVQLGTGPAAAEELIDHISPEKRLRPGEWRYQGSRVTSGAFAAQRDGSIISIIRDPDALIESGRVSADDDEHWRPLAARLPPAGAPVEIRVTFLPVRENEKSAAASGP